MRFKGRKFHPTARPRGCCFTADLSNQPVQLNCRRTSQTVLAGFRIRSHGRIALAGSFFTFRPSLFFKLIINKFEIVNFVFYMAFAVAERGGEGRTRLRLPSCLMVAV